MSGGGVRATRGARSEVRAFSRRCRPWLRVRRRHPYAATAGPAAFEASERRAPVARHRLHATVASAGLHFPRGGGRRAIGRVGAQVRRRRRLHLHFRPSWSSPTPLPSGCAPQAPARHLSASSSSILLLLLLYILRRGVDRLTASLFAAARGRRPGLTPPDRAEQVRAHLWFRACAGYMCICDGPQRSNGLSAHPKRARNSAHVTRDRREDLYWARIPYGGYDCSTSTARAGRRHAHTSFLDWCSVIAS